MRWRRISWSSTSLACVSWCLSASPRRRPSGSPISSAAASRRRRAAYVALAIGVLFMTAAALLLWTTPRILIGFYLNLGDATNQSTVAIALQLFVIAALFQLFDGVQVIAAGALRGYRDTAVPMLIAAIGYWAIGFVGGWLLAFPLGFGAVGLWLGLALGLAVVAIALGLRLHSTAPMQIPPAGTNAPASRGARGPRRVEPDPDESPRKLWRAENSLTTQSAISTCREWNNGRAGLGHLV